MSAVLGARLLEGIPRSRPIVLHFDLNRTIIQVDLAGGKTLRDILNNNLASAVSGICTALPSAPLDERAKATWRPVTDPDGKPLTASAPFCAFNDSAIAAGAAASSNAAAAAAAATAQEAPVTQEQIDAAAKTKHLMTYDEYVDEVVAPKPAQMDSLGKEEALKLWGSVTGQRRALKNKFTEAGQPGARFHVPFFTDMEARMAKRRNPDTGAVEATHFVIPAFFVMIETLWELRWPFRVVFRTFGHELKLVLDDVAKVLGERAPGLWGYVMRNAAEEQVLREKVRAERVASRSISAVGGAGTAEEDTHGPFPWCAVSALYRDEKSGSVVCHGVDFSPKSLDEWTKGGHSFTPTSSNELFAEFTGAGAADKPSSTPPPPISFRGFVDHYPWWAANGERDTAGKVFPVRVAPFADDTDPIQVFFDDNIYCGDEHSIVDLRDIATGANVSDPDVQRAFMVRCEPRFAILDEFYFVRTFAEAAAKQLKLRGGNSKTSGGNKAAEGDDVL